jgi:hypothetical protein
MTADCSRKKAEARRSTFDLGDFSSFISTKPQAYTHVALNSNRVFFLLVIHGDGTIDITVENRCWSSVQPLNPKHSTEQMKSNKMMGIYADLL